MKKDNICALASASGMGAISIIRVSGPDAIAICDKLFKSVKKGKSLLDQKSHTIHLGTFINNDNLIDEVLLSIFKDELIKLQIKGKIGNSTSWGFRIRS